MGKIRFEGGTRAFFPDKIDFARVFERVTLFFAFILPLIFFPFYNFEQGVSKFSFALLGISFLLVMAAIYELVLARQKRPSKIFAMKMAPLDWIVVMFNILCFISFAGTSSITKSFWGDYPNLENSYIFILGASILYFLTTRFLDNGRIMIIINALSFSISIAGLLSLIVLGMDNFGIIGIADTPVICKIWPSLVGRDLSVVGAAFFAGSFLVIRYFDKKKGGKVDFMRLFLILVNIFVIGIFGDLASVVVFGILFLAFMVIGKKFKDLHAVEIVTIFASVVLSVYVSIFIFQDFELISGIKKNSLSLNYAVSTSIGAFEKEPIFGYGIGNFLEGYTQNKPDSINMSDYWDRVVYRSNSWFLDSLITQGGLMIPLCIFFFYSAGSLFIPSVKKLKSERDHEEGIAERYMKEEGVFYFALLFIPLFFPMGSVLFVGYALYVSFLRQLLGKDEAFGKVSLNIFFIVVATLIGLAGVYISARVFAAEINYSKGLERMSAGDAIEGYEYLKVASELVPFNTEYSNNFAKTNLTIAVIIADQSGLTEVDKENIKKLVDHAKLLIGNNTKNLDPESFLQWKYKAEIYQYLALVQSGVKEIMLEASLKAVKLDPKNPVLRNLSGEIMIDQNNLEDATQAIDDALELRPDYPKALINRALLYRLAGNKKSAVSSLQRVLKSKIATEEEKLQAEELIESYKSE